MSIGIAWISSGLALYSITAARAARRLQSVAKSPIVEQFGLVLIGITTIRAFEKQNVYLQKMYRRIDDLSSAIWHMRLCHYWLIFRVVMIGIAYTTLIAAIIVYTGTNAGLAGFVLSVSIEYASTLFWSLYHISEMEMKMNAAERVIEYANLPTETTEGREPPASWPTAGKIQVKNLVVAYNHDLPPVLKGLNFSIANNER